MRMVPAKTGPTAGVPGATEGTRTSIVCMASSTAQVRGLTFWLQIEHFCSLECEFGLAKNARKFGSFRAASSSDLVMKGLGFESARALPGGSEAAGCSVLANADDVGSAVELPERSRGVMRELSRSRSTRADGHG